MEYENVLTSLDEGVLIVTVNRPDKLNALNARTVAELTDVFTSLPEGTRAVILTGSGQKAFIAGADIAELARMTPVSAREVSRRGQAMCDAIESSSVPVIAAINGYALGGGLEVALSAHVRLASDMAKMGLPEVTLGIIPGYGGSQRLPRLVGRSRAVRMITTGKMIGAEEGLRIGLVDEVISPDGLVAAAKELAGAIAVNAPIAVRYALASVNRTAMADMREGMATEEALFGLVAATDDMKEGLGAFLEKRKASFQGS